MNMRTNDEALKDRKHVCVEEVCVCVRRHFLQKDDAKRDQGVEVEYVGDTQRKA